MAWDDQERIEIEKDEGKQLTSYKDTQGNWTVGIGHFLGPNPIYSGKTITEEQCQEYFEEDFEEAVKGAQQACAGFSGLDGPRKGALVNMAFELGGPTLSTFHTFLGYVNDGLYQEAAIDLLNTRYAKQVPARAKRIAYRIQTGAYSPR
jgi:lysozyme